MFKQINRKADTQKRHRRIRKKMSGTTEFPRLAVYRSNKHIVAQIIDDSTHSTLVAASSLDAELKSLEGFSGANVAAAAKVGELLAKRAVAKGLSGVVFDRGGNLYHGRIAALAEAARAGGLVF
jgi:large subunit ribosomal protein L18